jgi:hypothetical protein
MALQTPTVGLQIPDQAGAVSGLGSEAINLVQQNQRTASEVASEQDLLTSQIPTAQAARREQLADLVSKAQIRRNTRALFPDNATEFQLNLAQRYQESTGRMPPINAQTGQVDFAAMNAEMARLADERMELERTRLLGRGGLGAGQATAAQVAGAQDELAGIQDQKQKLGRVRQLIADKTVNAVGPLRGTSGGRLLGQAQAAAGNESVYNKQRELEMWTNEQVITRSEKMKGQLSDKDIKFLVQSVPKLSDTEDVWTRFFDTYERALNVAAQNQQQRASGILIGEPKDVLAPPGFQPSPETNAIVDKGGAEVTHGTFSDDDLSTGRAIRLPTNPNAIFWSVPGKSPVPISHEDLLRAGSLQPSQVSIGSAPILPAP